MGDEKMKIVEIIRLEENFSYGTFGVLRINKEVFCVTLEPPDMLNLKNQSCIPAQQYIARKTFSPTYGKTFGVTNVPGRSHILFHPGNVEKDTQGCILLGEHFGKLRKDRAILNSGKTFERFMRILGVDDEFHLTILERY